MPVFSNSYKVTHNGVDLQISSNDLKGFANSFITDANVIGRCSERFILDLYVYANTSGLNPTVVIEEIQALESPEKQSRTKTESMFQRQPLKGLWHKHFFSSHFLPQNMLLAHGNGRIDTGKTHEDPRHAWASNLMTKLSLRAENRALCHIY